MSRKGRGKFYEQFPPYDPEDDPLRKRECEEEDGRWTNSYTKKDGTFVQGYCRGK